MQTNGTILSSEWIDFLRRYNFAVGVSLDGPPEIHDSRRLDTVNRPTSQRTCEGIKKLREAGIQYGVLLVLDDNLINLAPRKILDYLLEIGVKTVGILNVIPENTSADAPLKGAYLPFPRFVSFLRELFQVWWFDYKDRIVVRELASLVNSILGNSQTMCYYAGECMGHYLTVEPDGDVSACDKYVGDKDYSFGNLLDNKLPDLLESSSSLLQIKVENKRAVESMKNCSWFTVCHGGYPHDRRLNERYVGDYNNHCCGLEPLLKDIKNALNSNITVKI